MIRKILTVKNLNVVLDGKKIIKNLSFEVEERDNLAILGPNGSGKTVLLKTLLGLIPCEGEIDWAPGTKLGYVPQRVDVDLHLPLTLENLLLAKAEVVGIPRNEVKSVSEIVSLAPDILKTPVGHLSGGQFQKALICFSLLGKPNVLLFDEPTASLDQLAEEGVYDATKVLCINREKFCFGPPQDLNLEVLEKVYGSPLKHYQHDHS